MEEIIGSVATPVGRRLNMKVEKGKIIIDHDYGHIEINVGCFVKWSKTRKMKFFRAWEVSKDDRKRLLDLSSTEAER